MSENEMFISFKFNTTSIQNLFLEDHKKKKVFTTWPILCMYSSAFHSYWNFPVL